jgi:hypothetical protein
VNNNDRANARSAAARQWGERQLRQLGLDRVSRTIFGSENRAYRKFNRCQFAVDFSTAGSGGVEVGPESRPTFAHGGAR